MSEAMEVDGKNYLPSKEAARLTTYAQDYIGQLARKNLIDAKRIGGLWYVSMESLEAYKKKAGEYKPVPPGRTETPEVATLVHFDGKEFISAARASQETGYAQDYVGQLAREGKILSRQVGNRWYVERNGILSHKKEKDALLANVQAQAVGLSKTEQPDLKEPEYLAKPSDNGPLMNYFSQSSDLLPVPYKDPVPKAETAQDAMHIETVVDLKRGSNIAINKIKADPQTRKPEYASMVAPRRVALQKRNSNLPMLVTAVLTIVVVISIGYASLLKQNSVYASAVTPSVLKTNALTANVYSIASQIGNMLEPFLTHELVYQRSE